MQPVTAVLSGELPRSASVTQQVTAEQAGTGSPDGANRNCVAPVPGMYKAGLKEATHTKKKKGGHTAAAALLPALLAAAQLMPAPRGRPPMQACQVNT